MSGSTSTVMTSSSTVGAATWGFIVEVMVIPRLARAASGMSLFESSLTMTGAAMSVLEEISHGVFADLADVMTLVGAAWGCFAARVN